MGERTLSSVSFLESFRKGNRSKNRLSLSGWLEQAHLERPIQEIERSISKSFHEDFPSGSALGLNLLPPPTELILESPLMESQQDKGHEGHSQREGDTHDPHLRRLMPLEGNAASSPQYSKEAEG